MCANTVGRSACQVRNMPGVDVACGAAVSKQQNSVPCQAPIIMSKRFTTKSVHGMLAPWPLDPGIDNFETLVLQLMHVLT